MVLLELAVVQLHCWRVFAQEPQCYAEVSRMLRYSKFVNFNLTRSRRQGNVAVLETPTPRHEAISSTYVEVVVPRADDVPIPTSLERFLTPLAESAARYSNPVADKQTLNELFGFTAPIAESFANSTVICPVIRDESAEPVEVASLPIALIECRSEPPAPTLDELFADTEDSGPCSLNDIFKEMQEEDRASLHPW